MTGAGPPGSTGGRTPDRSIRLRVLAAIVAIAAAVAALVIAILLIRSVLA